MEPFNPPDDGVTDDGVTNDDIQSETEQLQTLLMQWESDELSEDEILRVREILRSSEAARESFVRWQMIHAALRLESELAPVVDGERPTSNSPAADLIDHPVEPSSERPIGPATFAAFRWTQMLLAVAASVMLCVLASRWAYLEWRTVEPPREIARAAASTGEEETSQGIALLTRLVDAKWSERSQTAKPGDALMPGPLAIDSGYAQVEFFCGATVIIEGPAAMELESATLARVMKGRLRAQVPPAARGFEIKVDDMRVVDLGTEFGLSVTDAGTDVQVFDGEVELHRPEAKKTLVTKGESFMRRPTGDLTPSELTEDMFVDIAKMATRDEDQTEARYRQWKGHSDRLRRHPEMIAYYTFDSADPWNRKLSCSIEPVNNELDGAIVGARQTQGRWHAKSALEFKRPGDRVRVQIPGEYGSLTFACWVKIDSLDRWYNSLLLTDNYQQGEPHWQILDTGQLFFSVRVSSEEGGQQHREVLSPPFWQPSMSGQWLHLATTYDVENQRTTHYLNGEMLSQEAIPDHQLVRTTRIGKATIGNWSLPTKPDAHFAIRNLNGSIDEFALLGGVLSASEIREMYEHGRP